MDRALERVGAAIHLPQKELTAPRLLELLGELATDTDRLQAMAASARAQGHPVAAAEILDTLDRVIDPARQEAT